MTPDYFFSSQYLFDPTPAPESKLYLRLLIFFSALILIAIFLRFYKKLDQKVRNQQFYCFIVCGILGFFYLFARYEGLPWLGSRFFLLLIIASFLIWILIITIWMARYLPKKHQAAYRRERFERYLPRKKR